MSSSDSDTASRRTNGGKRHRNTSRNTLPPTPATQYPPADDPELLLAMFLDAAKRLWLQIKKASSFIMIELGGYRAFDKVAEWCLRNPHIAICLVAMLLVMMLPFIILVGFGISTIAMTFTGFLVLEGTLLTVISMLLFGCLGALTVVLLCFIIIGVAAYFGFVHIYDVYGNGGTVKEKKNQSPAPMGQSEGSL